MVSPLKILLSFWRGPVYVISTILLLVLYQLFSFLSSSSSSYFFDWQARIKAINTFFAKNGYRSMDSSLYAQQSQSQSQYSSPLYMQHVYPQQQYPVYGIVPPTWTPSPTPYFETPLVRRCTYTAVRQVTLDETYSGIIPHTLQNLLLEFLLIFLFFSFLLFITSIKCLKCNLNNSS